MALKNEFLKNEKTHKVILIMILLDMIGILII